MNKIRSVQRQGQQVHAHHVFRLFVFRNIRSAYASRVLRPNKPVCFSTPHRLMCSEEGNHTFQALHGFDIGKAIITFLQEVQLDRDGAKLYR